MYVADLLEAKGNMVATVGGDATVGAVVAELVRHRIGALVVSPDGQPDRRHRLGAGHRLAPE